jgi:hypothetical protein
VGGVHRFSPFTGSFRERDFAFDFHSVISFIAGIREFGERTGSRLSPGRRRLAYGKVHVMKSSLRGKDFVPIFTPPFL